MAELLDPDDEQAVDAKRVANGDHCSEVTGYMRALEAVVDRYWFIGKAELIGGLAMVQHATMRDWCEQHRES